MLKNSNLTLLLALKSRFAGLMDPQRSRDDVVQVSSGKNWAKPITVLTRNQSTDHMLNIRIKFA